MKKAQIAMEYIITYGWALLAVMVLVAGLSFFGIFDPSDTLAENCYISSDIVCDDYQIRADGVTRTESMEIFIKNTHRENYYVSKLQCIIGSEHAISFNSTTFQDRDQNSKLITVGSDNVGLLETNRYVRVTCGGEVPLDQELATKGSKIKAKILLDVFTDTTFVHQIEGEVIATVK